MDLLPLVSSFGIIALAELGDKTQLTIISLSSCRKIRWVFVGAMLAFTLIDGVSALIGGTIAAFIPQAWIGVGAGVAFLLFGIYSLLSKPKETGIEKHSANVTQCFSLVALMELGDKTQLSVIALAAEYDAPIMVFTGVMLALALVTGIGIAVGTVISRFVPMHYLKVLSSLIFIIFGILFVFEAASGTRIL